MSEDNKDQTENKSDETKTETDEEQPKKTTTRRTTRSRSTSAKSKAKEQEEQEEQKSKVTAEETGPTVVVEEITVEESDAPVVKSKIKEVPRKEIDDKSFLLNQDTTGLVGTPLSPGQKVVNGKIVDK